VLLGLTVLDCLRVLLGLTMLDCLRVLLGLTVLDCLRVLLGLTVLDCLRVLLGLYYIGVIREPVHITTKCTDTPMKMEHTQCSETLVFKIQTPGNHPKVCIRQLKYFNII
jgi:hypothetical protein